MQMTCISIGKLRYEPFAEAAKRYVKRLRRYVSFRELELKAAPGRRSAQEAQHDESTRLLKRVPARGFVIALDEPEGLGSDANTDLHTSAAASTLREVEIARAVLAPFMQPHCEIICSPSALEPKQAPITPQPMPATNIWPAAATSSLS